MHPTLTLQGEKGAELSGRKIVLGITGSVASVRCPKLARELIRRGARVRAVMTPNAVKLITPELMHWATGEEVVTELTGRVEHLELAEWADLVLVAPATANTLSKIAHAIDDTSVTSVVSVALGLGKLVGVVPAMHGSMYSHKLFQQNLGKLKEIGVRVLEPKLEEGKAKMPEVEEVLSFVTGLLKPKDMEELRVVVTAGPTWEPIDPIKFITNRSSGKMGVALARAALNRGARVVLIYGPGVEPPPPGVEVQRVTTTSEMYQAFRAELAKGCDLVISAAAAQDFRVESPFTQKLRHHEPVTLRLVPAPRMLDEARELVPQAYLIGFKAEHGVSDEQLVQIAIQKLQENKLDMVVANDVAKEGAGFGTEFNEVWVVTRSKRERMRGPKLELADAILDLALAELKGRGR